MIYLDHSATTPALPEAIAVVEHMMREDFFNPAAQYALAVEVEKKVQAARSNLAGLLSARSEEIYYTSGGTESNNMSILGIESVLRPGRYRFITTKIEHASVSNVFAYLEKKGHDVQFVQVNKKGQVDLAHLNELVDEKTALVSIIHVSNELGTQQDLSAIRQVIRNNNKTTLLHSDGVQAYTKVNTSNCAADMYSMSGHKIYAPKGIGAVMIRKGIKHGGGLLGGGQEKGMRSGTLNTPGILGLDVAAMDMKTRQKEFLKHTFECKKTLAENLLQLPDVFINGPDINEGVSFILNVSFLGVRSEVLLHALENQGILISAGSACSSHSKKANSILQAIGLPTGRIESAVRFSFGWQNTIEQMLETTDKITQTILQLRKFTRK